ncbi:MAG: porphobilinogen deaminase [Actinotalea sp.]|nr:porphobilinogen deaminase [Actinotalea sp.]
MSGAQVRIGTRGSALALTQTGLVRDELATLAGLGADDVELVRVRTDGDRLTGSLAAIGGAGVFVAALREALLDGTCDLAVHSLKDLPTGPAAGLVVVSVPEREDPRDALCARDGLTLADLPPRARVGTGSPRRAAQLLAARRDLDVVDIRGNVDTRLARVTGPDADLDAVVLAAAGLARLGRLDAATQLLDPAIMVPAPGQGALAVECSVDLLIPGSPLAEACDALDHLPTRLAVTAERTVLETLEAGCAAPIGALGHVSGDRLVLDVVVCRPDGGLQLRSSASVRLPDGPDGAGSPDGPSVREAQLHAAVELGRQVAHHLLADGAADLAPLGGRRDDPAGDAEPSRASGAPDEAPGRDDVLPGDGAAAGVPPLPAEQLLAGWRVLVPRGGEWGERVVTLLEAHGATATVVPLIEFAPPEELTRLDSALTGLALGVYDWVTITSGTTVPYLAARAPLHVSSAVRTAPGPAFALAALLGNASVAAVGPGTAAALARIGITPDLVPSGERSAQGLLAEFPAPAVAVGPGLSGRVLVPHSDLAEPTLADGLRAKGWLVDDVVAYRTVSGSLPGPQLRDDVRSGAFDAVLLSSASTVTHLVELVGTPPPSTVVCCIGPRTERAALDQGLPVHVVPEEASAQGLVDGLVRYAQEVPRP